jgi:hypothetical protein
LNDFQFVIPALAGVTITNSLGGDCHGHANDMTIWRWILPRRVHALFRRSGMFPCESGFTGAINIAGLSRPGPVTDDMSAGDG